MGAWKLAAGSALEKGMAMAAHSSILFWRLPWTDEPGGLQSPAGVAKSWTGLSGFHSTRDAS